MRKEKGTSQRLFQVLYLIFNFLFLTGVLTQVYLAGMVVVAGESTWAGHANLGHLLGGPLVLMLASAYLGRIPKRMKLLSWLLFGVYFIQADVVIFMRGSAPLISALHPVLALIDFALALWLLRAAWSLIREDVFAKVISSRMQETAGD